MDDDKTIEEPPFVYENFRIEAVDMNGKVLAAMLGMPTHIEHWIDTHRLFKQIKITILHTGQDVTREFVSDRDMV